MTMPLNQIVSPPTKPIELGEPMIRKQVAISVAFAAFWAVFMIWWNNDYSVVNIIIFSVMGLILGFAWMWVMSRLGYFRHQ